MRGQPQHQHDGPLDQSELNATSDVSVRDSLHGKHLPSDEHSLPEALADYFNILREWSLSGRSDSGLAPDATEQP